LSELVGRLEGAEIDGVVATLGDFGIPFADEDAVWLVVAAYVGSLASTGRVYEARRLISELDALGELPPPLLAWSDALRPPRAVVASPGRAGDPGRIADWLRRNAAAHAGLWIALADGALLESDPSYAALTERLAARGLLQTASVFRVPG
jgi:phage terminase large subunit-like protein